MTQTFMEPTIDIPVEIVDGPECTAGYAWCNGDCNEPDDEDAAEIGWQNADYHYTVVADLPMMRFTRGGWQEQFQELAIRQDHAEGEASVPLVMLKIEEPICAPGMTAEQARKNAAWLLNAADLLDPLPTGVVLTTAEKLRIGDELLTDDGWQKVVGLIFFADDEQAAVFTPERHPDSGEGWNFSLNDPVKVRRHLTGSCALQFVEPIPASTTGGIQ